MRTDTLSYKYRIKESSQRFYDILIQEQLRFFASVDANIQTLEQGTTISRKLQTKMQRLPADGTMTITKIENNHLFQLTTTYAAGEIVQTYELVAGKGDTTDVIYSEKNTFDKTRNQYSFMFIGLCYKFFYNRGIKQRMQYLEKLAFQ